MNKKNFINKDGLYFTVLIFNLICILIRLNIISSDYPTIYDFYYQCDSAANEKTN